MSIHTSRATEWYDIIAKVIQQTITLTVANCTTKFTGKVNILTDVFVQLTLVTEHEEVMHIILLNDIQVISYYV